ncbi:hypothetical protein MTO96_018475 [Rhipicephalus appendiculatus]
MILKEKLEQWLRNWKWVLQGDHEEQIQGPAGTCAGARGRVSAISSHHHLPPPTARLPAWMSTSAGRDPPTAKTPLVSATGLLKAVLPRRLPSVYGHAGPRGHGAVHVIAVGVFLQLLARVCAMPMCGGRSGRGCVVCRYDAEASSVCRDDAVKQGVERGYPWVRPPLHRGRGSRAFPGVVCKERRRRVLCELSV